VKTDEQKAAAQNRGQAHREHRVAEKFAAKANEPGDERPFAVIAPIEVSRPIPIKRFIRREIKRAPPREVDQSQNCRRRDERNGSPAIAQREIRFHFARLAAFEKRCNRSHWQKDLG
jgi:hypothetical protein